MRALSVQKKVDQVDEPSVAMLRFQREQNAEIEEPQDDDTRQVMTDYVQDVHSSDQHTVLLTQKGKVYVAGDN